MPRFKTKSEFIREYGENWRQIVGFNWNGSMDRLCGMPISEDCYDKIKCLGTVTIDRWWISLNMVKRDKFQEHRRRILESV